MSTVLRIAGALLVACEDDYRLVGETKRPIDWSAAGFEAPEFSPVAGSEKQDWVQLRRIADRPFEAEGPRLEVAASGDALCADLKRCFVIHRNGSVSERLWDLVLDGSEADASGAHEAGWLLAMPESVWEIVRDSVLRC